MATLRRIVLLLPALLGVACTTTTSSPTLGETFRTARERDSQPNGKFDVRIAPGTLEFENAEYGKSDTDAVHLGLAFEAVGSFVGGGVRLGVMGTDEDLFPGNNDSYATAFELFPHLTLRPSEGRFRIPIRIGPALHTHTFTAESATFDDEISWYSLGVQAEIEPEIDLIRHGRSAVSIYGRARVGAGFGVASADTAVGSSHDDEYETAASQVGLEAGLRFNAGAFLLEGGYMMAATNYDETDDGDIAGDYLRETDFRFDGVFFAFGARW